MAQLKDTLIQGSARVTDTLYVNKVDTSTLNADNLETNLLKINTSGTDASSTTVGINLTNGNTINAHIGTSDSLGLYAANNIFMRPGGASGNSTEGMVLSTGALNPKDNALTLGNASHRWKSLYTAGYTYIYGNNQWCLDVFIYNKSKTQVGEIYYNSGNADNVTTGQYSFRQWSPKSTADTGTSGFHETFSLPAVTVGRTANAGYTIITTKNLSSITSLGTLASDLNFKAGTSDDSPDIVWWYGNNKEQARIWMGSGGTTKFAPNYRCYDSAGNSLYSGKLVIGDGTGASGTWGISITGSSASCTGNAATANRLISRGSVTAETGTNKPAVAGLSMSQVYNNGYPCTYGNVMTMYGAGAGQLLLGWSGSSSSTTGVRSSAFIRSQRDSANMQWSDWYEILDTGNYSSYALPLSGGAMSGTITLANTGLKTPKAAGFTTDQYGNFKHQQATASDTWQLLSNAGVAKFLYTWETGDLSISGGLTATNGFIGNATSATRIKTSTVTTNDHSNATGYFLVYTWTIGMWTNYRMSFIVQSRHDGNGLIDIVVGNNSDTISIDNMYAQIMYWGNTGAGAIISADSWVIHGSEDGTKAYLFAKYNDYNESIITPLTDTQPEKSTWVTSLSTSTYGVQKAITQINLAADANNATKLKNARKLWGKSFNGTANITGDMTNVGPAMTLPSGISTFGFYKSDTSAANANFGRLGLNSTYANIDITNYVLDANGASRFGGKVTVNHTTPTYAFSVSNSEKASIEYNSTNHVLNFIVT